MPNGSISCLKVWWQYLLYRMMMIRYGLLTLLILGLSMVPDLIAAWSHTAVLLEDVYNITNSEYQALVDLYNTTTGWEWIWSDDELGIPWNFTHYNNPCLDFWQGVTCSNIPEDGYLHVIELDLSHHGLDGYLPESIGNLVFLRNLSLAQSELHYGTIPQSIGQLTRLRALDLYQTFINGTIPYSIGNLTELVTIGLGNNNLHGPIPECICGLTQLVMFDVSANDLKGTIPECLGSLPNLLYLVVYFNMLFGTIPASLGNITQLLYLEIFDNYLTGSIPDSLSVLTNLIGFDMGDNLLTGTIPSWVGNMIYLTDFDIHNNFMNGTIPNVIGNLHQLETFYIQSNDLSGTLPLSVGNFVNLVFFSVGGNMLSGPCPTYFGNFAKMQYLTLFDNHFTGTFPADIGRATDLVAINIGANQIGGPLPSDLWNLTKLVLFVVSNNEFTSTVPESLLNLPRLHIIQMGLNHLLGQLPEAPVAPIVTFYSVGYNSLTGTIPASFGNVESLVYLNLSFNHLTSTMPPEITTLVKLNFLYLSNNLLTGPLPPLWDSMTVLSYVFLNRNFFSGTIPSSFGFTELLVSLNLSRNQLTGTIPVEFAQLPYLQVLLLQDNQLIGNIDKVLNSSFQYNLSAVQFSNNQLTGTLPEQLFLSDTLRVFAAVSNCFTGSIPLTLCNSSSINTLALDGLQSATSCRRALFPASLDGIVARDLYSIDDPLTGGVPACLFEMPALTTLHLSGNGLGGTLSEHLLVTPTLTDLSLSHNRLSGSIPRVLLNRPWVNLDLSFNLFTGTLKQEGPSAYAHNASISLQQNRLSGEIPGMFDDVESISVLESNLFACSSENTDLPQNDPNVGKYQCGSDTLNETLYAWLTTTCVVLMGAALSWQWRHKLEHALSLRLELLVVWWRKASAAPVLVNYTQVKEIIKTIVRVCLICTIWCLCVLMPIYIAMSFTYGTYTDQYAWTLSAAYLSGRMPFALEFTFLSLLIVVCYVSYRVYIPPIPRRIKTPTKANSPEAARVSSAGRRIIAYTCYLVFTFAIVMSVNVAYVVVALNENGNVLTLAQFALAVFKVGFNSLCSPLLIRCVSHYILKDTTSRDFVAIQLIVGLVHNIAIPCLVVAIISPSCFYNMFEASDPVQSSYTYNGRCVEYNFDSIVIVTCRQQLLYNAKTSYDPPFQYSYQCSSSFITYYAPAYVIMCILAGVAIPIVQMTLQVLHARATQGTRWFALLDLVLPRILKPLGESTDEESRRNFFVPHYDAQQHLTTILNYLGLLLTFGAVFPPLALCFLLTMCSIVAFTRLKVGRFLHGAGEENATLSAQLIDNACVEVDNPVKLHRAVLTVLVFSCVFYMLFLFDTLGDAVGFTNAYWVLMVVPLTPIILYFAFASALLAKQTRSESVASATATQFDIKNKNEVGDVELQCLEIPEVENPIHTK